jgi:hypothetical protein
VGISQGRRRSPCLLKRISTAQPAKVVRNSRGKRIACCSAPARRRKAPRGLLLAGIRSAANNGASVRERPLSVATAPGAGAVCVRFRVHGRRLQEFPHLWAAATSAGRSSGRPAALHCHVWRSPVITGRLPSGLAQLMRPGVIRTSCSSARVVTPGCRRRGRRGWLSGPDGLYRQGALDQVSAGSTPRCTRCLARVADVGDAAALRQPVAVPIPGPTRTGRGVMTP